MNNELNETAPHSDTLTFENVEKWVIDQQSERMLKRLIAKARDRVKNLSGKPTREIRKSVHKKKQRNGRYAWYYSYRNEYGEMCSEYICPVNSALEYEGLSKEVVEKYKVSGLMISVSAENRKLG